MLGFSGTQILEGMNESMIDRPNAVPSTFSAPSLAQFIPADASLLQTMRNRVHCRRPMQVVDTDRPSVTEPLLVGAELSGSAIRTGGMAEPAPVTTYRCECGFTLEEPA
jgi:hypothetical protein